MKALLITLLWIFGCVFLCSCMAAQKSKEIVHADGRVEREKTGLLALGGKGGLVDDEKNRMFAAQYDNEKSFRDGMVGLATAGYFLGNASVERAAAEEATKQLATKKAAEVSTTKIGATERAVTTLGSNPEANVGAIEAAGAVFKK